MISEIDSKVKKLESVFSLYASLGKDEEIKSHWAKYLCVLTSGFLEDTMKTILYKYIHKHANTNVAHFANMHIVSIRNLKEERLKQLLGKFNPNWYALFETKITEKHKIALDSIVTNKNHIAHGKHVGLTIARVTEYFKSIKCVLTIICDEIVKG